MSVYISQNSSEQNFDKNSWCILNPIEQSIKEKIERIGTPLKDWNVNINYGIKTGLNEAFIIDGAKKDELIKKDPKSAEIIRPILRGRDIKRYSYNFADKWLIATFPSKHYNIDDYPAVRDYLLTFDKRVLEQSGKKNIDGIEGKNARKKTNNKWFETQDSIAYWDDFSKQKIIYPDITKFLPFLYDEEGFMTNDRCFIITGEQIPYLTAFLNSSLFKFVYRDHFPELQGGTRKLSKIFFENIKVMKIKNQLNDEFLKHVVKIQQLKKRNIDTTDMEKQLDQIIFDIYNLTDKERNTIGYIEIK